MKLLPEQRLQLTQKLGSLRDEYHKLVSEKEIDKPNMALNFDESPDVTGVFTVYEIQKIVNEIKELEDLLNYSSICKNSSSNTIGVGSKFTVTIIFDEDDEETNEFILCEKNFGSEKDFNCVSIESPLGKAVFGKSENDSFEYTIGNEKILGRIEKIHNLDEGKKVKVIEK